MAVLCQVAGSLGAGTDSVAGSLGTGTDSVAGDTGAGTGLFAGNMVAGSDMVAGMGMVAGDPVAEANTRQLLGQIANVAAGKAAGLDMANLSQLGEVDVSLAQEQGEVQE